MKAAPDRRKAQRWQICEARELPNAVVLCDVGTMSFRRLMELLFAVILIAGLAVAPWAVTPAAAKHAHAAAMTDMPAMAFGMGLIWLLVLAALALSIATLIKYLRSDNTRRLQ